MSDQDKEKDGWVLIDNHWAPSIWLGSWSDPNPTPPMPKSALPGLPPLPLFYLDAMSLAASCLADDYDALRAVAQQYLAEIRRLEAERLTEATE